MGNLNMRQYFLICIKQGFLNFNHSIKVVFTGTTLLVKSELGILVFYP
jgi:hypothetical protein